MGLGDVYTGTYDGASMSYDEWLKKKQEEKDAATDSYKQIADMNKPDAEQGDLTPDMQANSGAEKLGGMVGNYYGPIGSAIGAAIGSMIGQGTTAHKPGEDSGMATGAGQAAAKAGMMSYLGGELSDATGAGDAASSETGNTLGDVYSTGNKYSDVTGLQRTTPDLSLTDKATNLATDYLHGASKGLIGGDFSPREGTGSFGNDLVNGLQNGGGIDRGIGNIRGGNYGEALGQAAKYTIDNYKRPHYNADDYKNKFTINYNTGY